MEDLSKELIENLPDSVVVVDESGKIVLINLQAENFFGYTAEEILGNKLEILLPQKLRKKHIAHRSVYLQNPKARPMGRGLNLVALKKDGTEVSVDINLSPIKTKNGLLICAVIRDITEQKYLESQIQTQAYYDVVTGLPNRFYFQEKVKETIENIKNKKHSGQVIIFIDIHNFKKTNEIYGRLNGDLLLTVIGERIKKLIRQKDIFARQAEDKFVILINDHNKSMSNIKSIIQRINSNFKKPFSTDSIKISYSVCMGISNFFEKNISAEELIQNAETALFYAKKSGPGSYSFFSKKISEILLKEVLIEEELRNAIKNKELKLVFQPIYDLNSNEIYGVEALLRWKNKRLGNIKPAEFIPIAERSGLMIAIDQWVIESACSYFSNWKNKYPKAMDKFMLSVNISTLQLYESNFRRKLINCHKNYHIPYENLIIEITETTLLRDVGEAVKLMKKINRLGIKFSIDDFGAGYSSLAYLQELPVYFLKIDQRFLKKQLSGKKAGEIMKIIIRVSRILGMSVIAEGVELKKQAGFLIKEHCPYAQGYYFSKPLTPDQLEKRYFKNKNMVR